MDNYTVNATIKVVFRLLNGLSTSEVHDVIQAIEDHYCRHCGNQHAQDSRMRCQCNNDD